MDAIDLKILKALQQDARLTHQDLSDRVGLSPTPCARRIRKLEQDGIGSLANVQQQTEIF